MSTIVLILIETALAIGLVVSLLMYMKSARQKKNTTVYGVLFDLCGIHLIALPILRAVYLWSVGGESFLRTHGFLIAIVVYLGVLAWDLGYIFAAYQKNKSIRVEKQKRKEEIQRKKGGKK